MSGKVSIITPSYNRAYIIDETAQSIFNQTYSNWEWVIVDDGSTDNSWEVIQQYANSDSRVKVYQRNREPKGACVCRNIAVEKCTGDYLIFLDTDDLLAPYCLQQRIKAIEEQPESDFVIFPMLIFKKKPDDMLILWNVDTEEDDLNRILRNDPICQGTGTIWKKESFKRIGMWKEDLMLWQDIELHIRSLLWPLKFNKRMDLPPDIYLRVSDDSLSRVGYFSEPKMKSRVQVFIDACNRINETNQFDKYREGLRVMGLDVIKSAINSRQYDLAKVSIEFSKNANVFSTKEISLLKRLCTMHKLRLYKLPFVYDVVLSEVNKLSGDYLPWLCAMKYQNVTCIIV